MLQVQTRIGVKIRSTIDFLTCLDPALSVKNNNKKLHIAMNWNQSWNQIYLKGPLNYQHDQHFAEKPVEHNPLHAFCHQIDS